MEHDDPIPNKKKGKKLTKKRKNESAKSDPAGVVNTNGIDHFTMSEATHGTDDSLRNLEYAICKIS